MIPGAGQQTTGKQGSATAAPTWRRSPVLWLVVAGVILISAIAAGTAMTVDNFRRRALDNSKRELENTVLLLSRHFDQQFQELQRIQRDLTTQLLARGVTSPDRFATDMSTYESHVLLKSKIDDELAGDIMVLDANGHVVNWSRSWPAPDVDLSDREYFNVMKSQPISIDDEFVQPLVSRTTGNWKTQFARRLSGPHGEFLGVVTRGIEPAQIEKYLASVTLGPNAAISMYHRDGAMLARFPTVGMTAGAKYSGALMQHIRSNDQAVTMLVSDPVDGAERIGTVRALRYFPIALVASTTIEAALADWRTQTKFLIGIGSASALIVAGLLFSVIRHIRAQSKAAQTQLTLEKNRLGTAINNMTQGLLLFDAQGCVVVCNQRYIDMYSLSCAVIAPGLPFRGVIEHRQATGSFSGDVDSYVDAVMRDVGQSNLQIMQTADGRVIQILSHPVAGGGWVATHEDITERRNAEQKIAHLAHYDALTDLPNRALFRSKLEQELGRVAQGSQCAVLYIDIDEFKGINDSLGHPVGDALLKGIAERLSQCVRRTDVVARLGGDEFAIVQTEIEGEADVTSLVAHIYEAIRQPFECLGHSLLTDASIGIALAPRDGTDLDELLKNADLAMYGAKSDGRRTFRFFEPDMDSRIKARRALEIDLRHAASDGGFAASGFEVYYQPLVNLGDDSVVGCEALLRWRHCERGMISPADFIPVAEEIGIINQLGEWVLETACMEAASWPDDTRVAVNVSPIQFRSVSLPLRVTAALAASGLSARRLELEITEAVLIRDDEVALDILHQLRAIGVRVALDDFGTGYSSLSYLQRFPFDKIKIDRCFVADIAESHGSSSIVQAVVNIAASRNMTTTAEGVETVRQKELLRALGCTEMQGYLFSAARPAAEIRALLVAHGQKAEAAA
jgi:diguanylate cyclase (GGDEF)-like protein